MTLPLLAGVALLAGGLAAKYALILKAAFLVDLYDRFGETTAPQTATQEHQPPTAAAT